MNDRSRTLSSTIESSLDMLKAMFGRPGSNGAAPDEARALPPVRIRVVGIGGAGGNAVSRMAESAVPGVEYLALNTDEQALRRIDTFQTLALGPNTTGGMGSGGNPDKGRRAARESGEDVARLLQGSDMVFVTAGMGGGTGTGAASFVAETARKQGALTVGVVTTPFGFEGPRRREVADYGVSQLADKVDTLITVDNDRLLSALGGEISLEAAFAKADAVLKQGVLGIAEIVTLPGLVNVDFADVKAIMAGGGTSFMAIGEGRGKQAAADAASSALSNPLFDAPLSGATGLLLNVKGGQDLALGEVHEVAAAIEAAASPRANVIFGVVHEPGWKRRVALTLVATGVSAQDVTRSATEPAVLPRPEFARANGHSNGHAPGLVASTERLV